MIFGAAKRRVFKKGFLQILKKTLPVAQVFHAVFATDAHHRQIGVRGLHLHHTMSCCILISIILAAGDCDYW